MHVEVRDNLDLNVDLVVVGIGEGSHQCDPRFMKVAEPLFQSGDLPLKPLETLLLPGSPRTLFIGLKSADGDSWRKAAATAVRRAGKARTIAFGAGDSRAIAEGAVVGSLSLERYKTTSSRAPIERIILLDGNNSAAQHGRILGESINWARNLINTPSNDKPPRMIAEQAREMAQRSGLEIDILDEARIRELKMGALLG